MDSVLSSLKSPWVLGGGVALGALILFMRSASGGAANASPSSSPTVGAYDSAIIAYNTAADAQITQRLGIEADVQKTSIQADVTHQVALLSTIAAIDSNHTQLAQTALTTNQGIIQSQLQTQSAVTMDISNNNNRLAIAGLQVPIQQIQSNAQVQIAKMQADATKSAAKSNAIGNIAKDVLGVAGAALLL